MSRGTNQFMLLQLVLFVLLYTTTFMNYSYASSSLANNTNHHFAGNNSSRFVTLDQLSAVAVMDLTGSIAEGCYRVMLKLGQHAQPYSFLIDTGSDVTWVNCQQRSDYQYPHPPYNPPARNTVFCGGPLCHHVVHPSEHPCNHTTDICHFVMQYVDGSYTKGKMIADSLNLPFRNVHRSLLPPTIQIGCAFDNRRPPGTSTRLPFDGILGLSKNNPITILEQLVNKGIVRRVFGHCMSRTRGGYFFMGAGQVLPHAITWAPMVTLRDPRVYSPGRANLVFDVTHTTVTNLDIVFDSGSTYSHFKTSALHEMIRLVMASLVGAPLTPLQDPFYPICWRRSRPIRSVDQVAAYFKTMTLFFPAAHNVQFELQPYNYLVVTPSGEVCFAILDSANIIGEMNIIGGTFFQNRLMIYDLDRMMIGWAPSNCNVRSMNDRKRHNVTDRKYRREDLHRHHYSTDILVRRQQQLPLANYTSIHHQTI